MKNGDDTQKIKILLIKYMEYRRLGKSGLQVSLLSFGSWITFGKQIDDTTADELMSIAYDNGVNFFDNAEIYACLLYTSPSPRDRQKYRMPSSA